MCSSVLILTILVAVTNAGPQGVKGVVERPDIGPAYGQLYNHTAILGRFTNTTSVNSTSINSTSGNNTHFINLNAGVCYEEVPTATLVKNKAHIPEGNGTRPGYSRILTCCKGYSRHIHIYRRCEPICTQPCINAVCSAPETCTCIDTHVKNLAGFCVPTCPLGCQDGECAGGECLCNPGFKLDPDSKFCIPVCEKQCGGHGNCTAPEKCECHKGYLAHNDGICKPKCDNCEYGQCVAPGVCDCRKGYTKNEHGECIPVCSRGCENGICIAPDVCSCHYGHELKDGSGRCEPKCLKPCINGVCAGPDTCQCNKGFILDEADPTGTKCLPHCPGGCPNGVCSGPNFCICNFGYIKDRSVKGAATCVRRTKRSADIRELLIFNIPPEDHMSYFVSE